MKILSAVLAVFVFVLIAGIEVVAKSEIIRVVPTEVVVGNSVPMKLLLPPDLHGELDDIQLTDIDAGCIEVRELEVSQDRINFIAKAPIGCGSLERVGVQVNGVKLIAADPVKIVPNLLLQNLLLPKAPQIPANRATHSPSIPLNYQNR